ncbi:MAG: hypothetical protein SGI77_03895 [Pirellulaceae bacterium]|nr:hypothetical protein [Pirellulaceae bacterium]
MQNETSAEYCLDEWKVEIIKRRARQRGFRHHDLEDAVQSVAIEVMQFKFDSCNPNQACEETALIALIDRRLAMIWRGEYRRKNRWIRHATEIRDGFISSRYSSVDESASAHEFGMEVAEIVSDFDDLSKSIVVSLAKGDSTAAIAEQHGMSWKSAASHIDRIRRAFTQGGFEKAAASTTAGGWV